MRENPRNRNRDSSSAPPASATSTRPDETARAPHSRASRELVNPVEIVVLKPRIPKRIELGLLHAGDELTGANDVAYLDR